MMFSKARALDWPAAICLSSVCLWWAGAGSRFLFYFPSGSSSAVFGLGQAKTKRQKRLWGTESLVKSQKVTSGKLHASGWSSTLCSQTLFLSTVCSTFWQLSAWQTRRPGLGKYTGRKQPQMDMSSESPPKTITSILALLIYLHCILLISALKSYAPQIQSSTILPTVLFPLCPRNAARGTLDGFQTLWSCVWACTASECRTNSLTRPSYNKQTRETLVFVLLPA